MPFETTRKALFVLFVAAAAACVSTELQTGAEHPANPRAPAQPPPPASSALRPNFEPFAAYGVAEGSEASDHDPSGHAHAEMNSDAVPSAEHAEEAAPPSEPQTQGASTPAPSVPEATGSKAASPPQKKKAKKPQYTCPMHPEVRSPDPGRCPKCGMPLVLEKQKAP